MTKIEWDNQAQEEKQSEDVIEIAPLQEQTELDVIEGKVIHSSRIEGSKFRIGSGNEFMGFDPRYGLWAGDSDFNSAPFKVDLDGNVTGSSATFSQYFNKSSDDIGDIDSGTILSKAFTLAVSAGQGDTKIQAGKTDFGDTTNGFILGIDDSDSDIAKFEIGGSARFFKLDDGDVLMSGSFVQERTAGEDLKAGDAAGIANDTNDDDEAFICYANATEISDGYLGLVLEDTSRTGTARIATHGLERLWSTNLTRGDTYYIDDATVTKVWGDEGPPGDGFDDYTIDSNSKRFAQTFDENVAGSAVVREVKIRLQDTGAASGVLYCEIWNADANGPTTLIDGATSFPLDASTLDTGTHPYNLATFYFVQGVYISNTAGTYAIVIRPDLDSGSVNVQTTYDNSADPYDYGNVYYSTDSGSNWSEYARSNDTSTYDNDTSFSVNKYEKKGNWLATSNLIDSDVGTVSVKVGKALSIRDMRLQRPI